LVRESDKISVSGILGRQTVAKNVYLPNKKPK